MKEAQTGSACQSAGPPRAGIRQCVSGPKSLCVCVSGASSVSKQWPYRGTTLQCSGPFSVWTSPSLQPHRGNDTPVCASPRFSMSVCERGPFPTRDSRATGWAGEIGSAVMPASPGSQAHKHLSAFTLAISKPEPSSPKYVTTHFSPLLSIFLRAALSQTLLASQAAPTHPSLSSLLSTVSLLAES